MPTLNVKIPTSLKIALDKEIARVGGDDSAVTAALAGHLGTPVHTLFQTWLRRRRPPEKFQPPAGWLC
jgi:hypothetical protein